ncbi:FHA domain-containing protein [Natrinema caseinilyticum]|uniref:FHA domain-containing protein n=1 Tax=Natrinema caseinilyticum TaxID=2961570 RepID=UPI0020C58E0D|nr:FHA domain-containing protein [Natrinema caseinilyticum]
MAPIIDAPARSALLTRASSGQAVRVGPDDTLGRWAAEHRVPSVVLPDDERFLCPEHAVLGHDGVAWHLRDRSLNGTFVGGDGDWAYILSRDGRRRRLDAGSPLPRPDPATSIRLSDGDRIAPVSPGYGCQLTFRAEE